MRAKTFNFGWLCHPTLSQLPIRKCLYRCHPSIGPTQLYGSHTTGAKTFDVGWLCHPPLSKCRVAQLSLLIGNAFIDATQLQDPPTPSHMGQTSWEQKLSILADYVIQQDPLTKYIQSRGVQLLPRKCLYGCHPTVRPILSNFQCRLILRRYPVRAIRSPPPWRCCSILQYFPQMCGTGITKHHILSLAKYLQQMCDIWILLEIKVREALSYLCFIFVFKLSSGTHITSNK